ncbi:MAG: hypothetical protein LQ341_001310 [Variospora aurantia]|nr:MAG: hypothetical protein LQ341_001310 [Variospora aurantia]
MAPRHQRQRLSKDLPFHRIQENGDSYSDPPLPVNKAETRTKASLEILNENSPLLSPQRIDDDGTLLDSDTSVDELDFLDGDEQQESKSVWYLLVLTLSIGGLQIAWATEISNGSPYLLSLGMSKALLAIVWIAGPLSGTIVQPYIGIMSDNSRYRIGKRKPFMIGGAVATLVSFLALAWTREIVHTFLGLFGADPESQFVKVATICFAIGWVCLLDVAINTGKPLRVLKDDPLTSTVQAGIRAFIVDNAPTHQQEDANAWAGIILGIGSVLGYLSGYVNLPKIMPFFGNTQFKVLSVITCIAMGGTVTISCLCITERDPRHDSPPPAEQTGIIAFFRQIYRSARRLSPQIRKVCEVQFFNWMGWFPFLFYITTYIGQLHVNPIFRANPGMTPKEVDEAWESATRVGSFALLVFAITSFSSNMLLPFFVVPTYRAPSPLKGTNSFHSAGSAHRNGNQPTTPSGTPLPMSASMTSFFPPLPDEASHSRLARLLSLAQIPWLTLRRAWLLSHLLFALCMASTFFITTPLAATILAGVVGLAWALTLWAPFALISAEISKRDAQARKTGGTNDDQAGVVLGLHNVAISAPQMLATLVSSAIFRIAQKPRGEPGDDSVGWVMRFGGLAALVASYMTSRLKEEGKAGKAKGKEDWHEERGDEQVV